MIELPDRIIQLGIAKTEALIAYLEQQAQWDKACAAYRNALLEHYGLKVNDVLPVTDQFRKFADSAAENAWENGIRYPDNWPRYTEVSFRSINEDGYCTCDIVGQQRSLSVHVPLEVIDEMVQLKKQQDT